MPSDSSESTMPSRGASAATAPPAHWSPAAPRAARPVAEELLDYVVRINMGVARSVASRYANRGIEEDDLVQVAYAALTRAARDFDPGRHEDFLSYAVPTIRGELKKHFRDHGWTVRPPRRVQETQARITRAEGELVQKFGRLATPAETADHLGAEVGRDRGDVRRRVLLALVAGPPAVERRRQGCRHGGRPARRGRHVPPAAEARVTLAPVVRRLKERDRRILYMRFFEERTQQEIADDIGVTQMQVSRLLSRIMRDLRTELGSRGQRTRPSPDQPEQRAAQPS